MSSAVVIGGRVFVRKAELRPSLVGDGLGRFPVYSALVYLSQSKHRGTSPASDLVQDLIEELKKGKPRAIQEGASLLARHPGLQGFRGVVTPAPRSSASRPSNMKLAKALVAEGVGSKAVDLVTRATSIPSSRLRRREKGPGAGTPYEEHLRSMSPLGDVPEEEGILIVDDIFTSGATLRAAADTIQNAGYEGPIFSATVGYYQSDPSAVLPSPVKYRAFYV